MRMITAWLAGLTLLVSWSAPASAPAETAAKLEERGKFAEASAALDKALAAPNLPSADRKILEFEKDRLRRISKDFPYTDRELFEQLKKAVANLTWKEFQEWDREGRFDVRTIDGARRYMVSSVSNLFFRYPGLNPRRLPPPNSQAKDRALLEFCRSIREAARAQKTPYVLQKNFAVTMQLDVKPGVVPEGETVRAWFPVPRDYPFQQGFELTSSSTPVKHLDNSDSPIRSAYLEQPAPYNGPVNLKIEYRYTTHGVWFEVDPNAVKTSDVTDPKLSPFLREAPHVQFSPEIRALSKRIVADETNPYLKAKRCYNWIADNIKYSYAIEYSTIRNISEYCRSRGYGDCGQEALLFITLCRLNGIPARWQSGWHTVAGAKTIHDWSEIYIAPYGWMPVDPYMGIYAMRYANTLTPTERRQVRDFFFGGLDQYRMIANSDHSQQLTPPKASMRSDTVDFQRGELEAGGRNIYFDQYSYRLDLREITPP